MFPELILSAVLSSHPCITNPRTEDCIQLVAILNGGEDVEGMPGYEWYHTGHSWDVRPRVRVQILTELPDSPSCKNPYSYAIGQPGNDCSNVQAPPRTDTGKPEWIIGYNYNPAYPGAIFTVTNISYSTKRPGVMIVTGEWNTEGTMPLSFYADQQPGPFFKVP